MILGCYGLILRPYKKKSSSLKCYRILLLAARNGWVLFSKAFFGILQGTVIRRNIIKKCFIFFSGCLTTVFQAFLGIQAGSTLRTFSSTRGRITRWAIWGLITGLAGLAIWLAVGIPLNKSLW